MRLAAALDGGDEGVPKPVQPRWRAWWAERKLTLPRGPITPQVCEEAFADGFAQGYAAGYAAMARIWDKNRGYAVD